MQNLTIKNRCNYKSHLISGNCSAATNTNLSLPFLSPFFSLGNLTPFIDGCIEYLSKKWNSHQHSAAHFQTGFNHK